VVQTCDRRHDGIVASLDHHLHIIDPSSNENINTVDMGGAIPGGATAAANGVYVGSFTGRLEAVSSSGQNQTLAESEDWIWGAPALKDDTLYFADLGGRVYSLDLVKDVQNWGEIKPNGPIAASLLPVDDMVVIVTESVKCMRMIRKGKRLAACRRVVQNSILTCGCRAV
jgi:outer membrane protein assembly factor BamB